MEDALGLFVLPRRVWSGSSDGDRSVSEIIYCTGAQTEHHLLLALPAVAAVLLALGFFLLVYREKTDKQQQTLINSAIKSVIFVFIWPCYICCCGNSIASSVTTLLSLFPHYISLSRPCHSFHCCSLVFSYKREVLDEVIHVRGCIHAVNLWMGDNVGATIGLSCAVGLPQVDFTLVYTHTHTYTGSWHIEMP